MDSVLKQRSWLTLRRLADAAGVSSDHLREALEDVIELPVAESAERKTGATWKKGEGHASGSYVSDPNGTAVVPAGIEPPPGYFGR
jgi:hypothetical protein